MVHCGVAIIEPATGDSKITHEESAAEVAWRNEPAARMQASAEMMSLMTCR